jgi:acyl-CoA reductase-like NAD-dependent aldehyde dehydrogenase
MSTASADRYVASEPYGFFIGGEEVAARETLPAIEPSTGNEWARIGQATADDADRAVEAARVAFRTWRRTSLRERQDALLQLAEVVESWEGWPALLATENGRPIREAIGGDVPIAADIFRYYAGLVRDQSGANLQTGDPNLQVFTVREPLGPIAAIIPWNSPLITTALKLAPALAAGNTVVMKPSEFASASVVEFARRAEGILPAGAINVVTGGPAVGAALVGNPDIAKISFTGGVETARAVMRAANENLTPALLELGGKSAFVVCDDAELEPAVHDALSGIFFQNGQVCFAASRLFVHAEIYETFMNRLLEVARRIRIGDALDPETQVGPLVSAPHRDRVLARITDAQREGASVRAGGSQLTLEGMLSGGFYIEPTVLEDRAGTSSAARSEIFGPVLVAAPWTDEEDVVARANGTEYGLAAGVWTSNLGRAHRIAAALDAGTVWVNTWFDIPSGQPLGGVKRSGHGREMCAETLLEYSSPKAFSMRLTAERPPLWG